MKNFMNKYVLSVLVAALALASGAAHAELPAEATAAFATTTTNWTSMSTLIWGLLVAITGGFALMKMFKKGLSRAI